MARTEILCKHPQHKAGPRTFSPAALARSDTVINAPHNLRDTTSRPHHPSDMPNREATRVDSLLAKCSPSTNLAASCKIYLAPRTLGSRAIANFGRPFCPPFGRPPVGPGLRFYAAQPPPTQAAGGWTGDGLLDHRARPASCYKPPYRKVL